MAVAIETRRGPDQSIERLLEFNARLYQALKIKPNSPNMSTQTRLQRKVFKSAENMAIYGAKVAEKVANHWVSIGYKPDPEVLLNGLVDFAIEVGKTVKRTMSEMDPVDIEERMKELAIRIRGMVVDSEDRMRNLRTDRDNFTACYIKAL